MLLLNNMFELYFKSNSHKKKPNMNKLFSGTTNNNKKTTLKYQKLTNKSK